MFVDSHAHIYSKEFQHDLDDVIKRAQDAGVDFIVCPGTDVDTSRRSIDLAVKYEMVYACVGIHPHDASKADDHAFKEIEELSRHPKVVAIGEIGLDYHYNFSPPEVQKSAFARQIEIAQRRNLPIVIHSRKSEDDVLRIVESKLKVNPNWRHLSDSDQCRYPSPKGVFHCFPGDVAMARKVINWGFYVSLPGPVTFGSKSGKPNWMEEIAAQISVEHILLETDSPYLTPAPHRGRRNEPSYVRLVAEKIAELQHLSIEDVGRASSLGAYKLFGIGSYPEPVVAYKIQNSLYLNITLRCNADCTFCDRKNEALVKGHNLRITAEPTTEEVIEAIGDPTQYEEIVFCGFGEPTIRLDVVKEVARWVKQQGGKVRLNTDGHGSVINHRNIVSELVGLVDAVSISLNTADPRQYGELMRLDEKKFFPAMIDFAKECVKHRLDVTMTVVDTGDVDEEKARILVEQEIGAKFKSRLYF